MWTHWAGHAPGNMPALSEDQVGWLLPLWSATEDWKRPGTGLFKKSCLSLKDFKKLIFFSQKVLKNAISKGGSTIQNFKSSYGELGSFQKHFKVYDREGKKCLKKRCEGIVKKKVISNRSSFYCNICQKIWN